MIRYSGISVAYAGSNSVPSTLTKIVRLNLNCSREKA